jgi:hypothetical protein
MSVIDDRRRGAGNAWWTRRVARLACVVSVLAGLAMSAAVSAADPTLDLKSSVDSARGGSCPALQSDSILNQVAQRANLSTDSYIGFTNRSQPLGSPSADVIPALHQLGFPATKAKVLSGYGNPAVEGYGDVTAKAIYGAVLQGYEALPDCSYTAVGVDLMINPDKGYALATVILVAT